MTLSPNDRLGSYVIVDSLGKGGMGEVYRARDTKLDRHVAIKVLPAEFSRDRERLVRFEREAKLLASLNHPEHCHDHGARSKTGTRRSYLETT
jgi:serine/threonine-protein kinase